MPVTDGFVADHGDRGGETHGHETEREWETGRRQCNGTDEHDGGDRREEQV